MIWGIAMLVMATGMAWADRRGTLAGGILGLIYMLPYVVRSSGLENFLTEVPTTFWVVVFGFCFVLHQKTGQMRYFVALTAATVCLIYTRANFLMLLPLFAVYFFFAHYGWRKVLIFVVIVGVPVALWSAYASAGMGKFVSFTTQGELAFPQYNNLGVITGFGPDRINQGGWNPGNYIDTNGVLRNDDRFVPKQGENGWVMGLTFWRENPTLIPALFYVKLRAGFWTREELVGIYTMGLCFLLIAPGFRVSRRPPRLLPQVSDWNILKIQVALAFGSTLLMIFVGAPTYWLVLIAYAVIFALALLRPYGNVYHSSVASPIWFLLFVGSHLITTLLYMGIRFHEPMDPLLCMYGIYGAIIFLEALVFPSRRHRKALIPEIQQVR
jgi:hypothetical protein